MNLFHDFLNGLFLFVFYFILFASTLVMAEETCGDLCGKPTTWDDFNVFTLKVNLPDQNAYGLWHGQYDKNSNDIRIEAEASDGKVTKTGTILMIGGRIMATKGNVIIPGYEIDALDGAVLQQQLVFRLLGAAMPEGAANIKGEQKIDFANARTGIQFATSSAEGYIAPPWKVKGSVKSLSPDVIEYELHLTSGVKDKRLNQGGMYSSDYSGQLSKKKNVRLDDELSLEGWNVLGVGVQSKAIGETNTIDYSAAPAPVIYKKIADVRKKLNADDTPGEPDASKDFTGFWKEKCEQNFGIQIKHYGTDGKYSTSFCGPGGCFSPEEARKTFITGDKKYQIISDDKIIEIMQSGNNQTYFRCTKDPNPVLK